MGHNKGFFGNSNKKNDLELIRRITELLASPLYKQDIMTEAIKSYIFRYNQIHSMTDKMRFIIKKHLELHKRENENM
jgi:hypothetical protein